MPAAPAPPTLPAPSAAPVAAETRLAYVLRHFRLAYEQVPDVSIGYAASQPTIIVADGARDFFRRGQPYPPMPNVREWRGRAVPFFFDPTPEAPLLTLGAGRATINSDLVAAAFYLLSGWQEYFSEARDRHGRFPYAASVQKQYGFVTLPVVNYYFDVLKTAVEHVTGQPLRRRPWPGGAPFAAFISHDIDTLHGGWGTAARYLVRHGQWAGLARLLTGKARGRPAPWDNLEAVLAATARFGAPATFFLLGNRQPAPNGTPNADYASDTPAFRARLARLVANGAELATHGSYGTATDAARLRAECQRLPLRPPLGNRFHYLSWEPTRTPEVLDVAGVAYDSTLGFAEHIGFRHSYCLPFFPFDFTRRQPHAFLEIPLTLMDTTLHHPSYLQLWAEEIGPTLRPLFDEIESFGGVTTVLWHNNHFDPANEVTGPQQFAELLADLQRRGAAFLTGSAILRHFCPTPAQQEPHTPLLR